LCTPYYWRTVFYVLKLPEPFRSRYDVCPLTESASCTHDLD
jgi:hypothetical protein